jgi:hypothetical protein
MHPSVCIGALRIAYPGILGDRPRIKPNRKDIRGPKIIYTAFLRRIKNT